MPRPARGSAPERKVATPDEPVNESRDVENPRPRRSDMRGNFRDRLTVPNKDPNYEYRWVIDTDASGARIFWMKEAGWELAPNPGKIGETDAKHLATTDDTRIARVPANKNGEYHYLMRIKKEWYDEIQAEKAEEVNKMDRLIHTQRDIPVAGTPERLYNTQDNKTEQRMDRLLDEMNSQ